MTSLRAAILGIVLPLLTFAQSRHLQQGLEYFKQQRYPEALQEFEQARSAYPTNPAIENVLGITSTKLNQLNQADQHYKKALALNPSFEDAHKNLGFNYLNEKQWKPAESELKSAIALAPNDPYPHFYLVMVYLATSRDRLAAQEAQPSLPLLRNDPDVAFNLTKACLRTNQFEQGATILSYLEENSHLSPAQEREIALLLFEKGKYTQAAERFQRLAAADPKTWEDKYNLAVALLHANDIPGATTVLESLAAERPEDVYLLGVLGSTYESSGKNSEALRIYKKEVSVNPRDADSYLDYSKLLMDLNRYDEAVEFVTAGLQSVREPYPLFMRLGSIDMMAGKYDEARGHFDQAIAEHPDIPVGYVALAQFYFKSRDDEKAAKVLSDARTKLKPDYLLEYYYGLALDRLGKKEEAVSALQKAARLNSQIPDIQYELGRIYFDLNRLPLARAEFEKVIELNPTHSKAYFQLSRISARLGDQKNARKFAEQTKQLKQAEREDPKLARLQSFQPMPLQ